MILHETLIPNQIHDSPQVVKLVNDFLSKMNDIGSYYRIRKDEYAAEKVIQTFTYYK